MNANDVKNIQSQIAFLEKELFGYPTLDETKDFFKIYCILSKEIGNSKIN